MEFNYSPIGETNVAEAEWRNRPSGFSAYERTVRIGQGDDDWKRLSDAVMHWEVTNHAGLTIKAVRRFTGQVRDAENYTFTARMGPLRLHEPVRVVAVVDEADRRGFAYGTQHGHPVAAEEAFIAHRDASGVVWLTVRSLMRRAPGVWGAAYPLVIPFRGVYRRRYLRALR